MIIWDTAKTISQKLAQDSSADAVTFLDTMMNVGYKIVLQTLGRQVTEQQATSVLEDGRRGYMVPPDCLTPKMITLLDGTKRTPLIEIASDEQWEYRRTNQQSGTPGVWHYRPRFGVGGGTIEVDPIPSGNAYSIEMIYEATERDLENAKHTTGTITLTNGSTTVAGAGTPAFTSDMVGRYLRPTTAGSQRLWYRIAGYTNSTTLTLENKYHGTTQAGMNYEIAEVFALPEDCQMLPVFYSAWQWWEAKGNARAARFEKLFSNGLKEAKKAHASTTRDNRVNPGGEMPAIFGEVYPSHFPLEVA